MPGGRVRLPRLDPLGAVRAGKVGEDDANALYVDSVLTVEPNTRHLERTVTDALL